MIAAIEEIETEERLTLKALFETLPELIYDVADVLATMYYNTHAKTKIKHIFEKRPQKAETEKYKGKTIRIPRPDGGFDEIEIVK